MGNNTSAHSIELLEAFRTSSGSDSTEPSIGYLDPFCPLEKVATGVADRRENLQVGLCGC